MVHAMTHLQRLCSDLALVATVLPTRERLAEILRVHPCTITRTLARGADEPLPGQAMARPWACPQRPGSGAEDGADGAGGQETDGVEREGSSMILCIEMTEGDSLRLEEVTRRWNEARLRDGEEPLTPEEVAAYHARQGILQAYQKKNKKASA